MVWVVLACSGQLLDSLHCTATPTGCARGGGGGERYPFPLFWGWEIKKKYVSKKDGTVGELYKGNIMKKWGRTSLLMGSCPEW